MSSNAQVVQFVGRGSNLGTVEVPSLLTNDVEVQESDKTIVYRGQVFRLFFDGLAIRGNASISRIKRETVEVDIVRRPYWWKPWVKEVVDTEERVKDTTLWRFQVDDGAYNDPSWGCTFLIDQDGTVPKSRAYGFAYRGELVGVAATSGVVLSDELLEAVFKPIDEELQVLHRRVARG